MSTFEYGRPRDERDADAVTEIMALAFGRTDPDDRLRSQRYGQSPCRLVRIDERPVAAAMLLPFEHWFGGNPVTAIGYNGVATLPEARGTGAGAHLMRGTLMELNADGVGLASLYSSNDPFYERAGFAAAGWIARQRLETWQVPRVDRPLVIERLGDDWCEVARDLDAMAERRGRVANGVIRRPPMMWHRLMTQKPATIAYRFLREAGNGASAEGFAVVSYEGLFSKVVVPDLCLLSVDAVTSAVSLLAGYGSNPEGIEYAVGPADPVLDAVGLPLADFALYEAWLLRLVNLPTALGTRGYLHDSTRELDLDVVDEVVPENTGRWQMRVSDGRAEVARGGSGRVKLSIGTLAQLYSGRLHPLDPTLTGRLEAEREDLLELARLFDGQEPYSVDFY